MLVSTISGALVIIAALFFQSLQGLTLFDLMMQVSSLIQVPLLVPLLFGLLVKRTPQWAPWVTVLLGLFVSWFMTNVVDAQTIADWLGLAELTAREASDMNLMMALAAHLFITAGFFCATSLLYREGRDVHKEETARFFDDLDTPVVSDDMQDGYDRKQRDKLGTMVLIMGLGMLAMVLIPNPASGRIMFAICAAAILGIAWLLKRGGGTQETIG